MYQVLYRKWRPTTFEEISGQPQVTVTLKNELRSSRINHAYLFTGSRGTGKTTCAKVLAKAVNCLDLQDGNPCGKCENCLDFEKGEMLSVEEIDAASNTGVDNIRGLIEESAFAPPSGKYRVYIIDEVHMLSMGAFNALLKTLEEPPAHVVFILATTEVHKLPATILSRCQRFDFHRIDPKDISDRLMYVAGQEGIELDEPGALLIAHLADGALRDALSILDRCVSNSNIVNSQTVRETVGLAKSEYLFEMTDSIYNGDVSAALTLSDKLYKESKDLARLCEELSSHMRNLMLIKTLKKPQDLVVLSDEEYKNAKEQSQLLTISQILRFINVLQTASDKMYKGFNKRVEFEMALIKLCSPKSDASIESLVERLEKLERTANRTVYIEKSEPTEQAKPKRVTLMDDDPADEVPDTINEKASATKKYVSNDVRTPKADIPLKQASEQNTAAKPSAAAVELPKEAVQKPVDFEQLKKDAVPMENWQEVLSVLEPHAKSIAQSFKNTKAFISGQYILIDAKSEMPFKLLRQSAHRDQMRFAIKEVTGKTYKLGPYNKTSPEQKEKNILNELQKRALESGIEVTAAQQDEE